MSVGRRSATLANPAVLEERIAARDTADMRPLNSFVMSLRERHGVVPDFDPHDGGAAARLLLILETPGPGSAPVRFVSRDNATGTAANLRRFLDTAEITRRDSIIWNAVPWVIHAPNARNRPPRRAEAMLGLLELPPLLDLLPRLAVVVLAGRVAAEAEPLIAAARPGLPILVMPHPSPTIVCTSPMIARSIAQVLAEAATLVAAASSAAQRSDSHDSFGR